jgi:hypothetical protein
MVYAMQHFYKKSVSVKNLLRKKLSALVLVLLSCMIFQSAKAQTITVNTLSDVVDGNTTNIAALIGTPGGAGISLREAIIATNNEPAGATITINLGAGTHQLTIAGAGENASATGDLDLNVPIAGTKTVTIQGVDSTLTIIQQTIGDRLIDVHPINNAGSITFNVNGVRLTGGNITGSGGAMLTGRPGDVTNITNCAFATNTASTNGGAISQSSSLASHNLTITNCSFLYNTGGGAGGAVNYNGIGTVLITGCKFIGNSLTVTGGDGGAVTTSGGGAGGTYTIEKNSFVSNRVLNATAHGGAIGNVNGILNVQYNRFINNTAATAANGNTLYQAGGSLANTITANNNWWGVNTGPAANDAAVGTAPVTAPVMTTWLQLKTVATSTSICTGAPSNTTLITSGFTSNSAGAAISAANLTAMVGLPISFSATLGTLSGAQATIQASGNATATFTSNGTAGSATVNAVVDNVPVGDLTARATITVSGSPSIAGPGQPTNVALCGTTTAVFTVTATGAPTLTYQWFKGVTQLNNGPLGAATISGATTATLTITNASAADDAANYNVVVTNSCGNVTSNNASLTVSIPPTINPPTVTQPSCGSPTGTIVVNATGAGTLEYSVDNGGSWQTSNTFAGLTPGNYNIRVRLQSSPTCFTTYASNPVVILTAVVAPTVNAPTLTQPTCAVPTGTIVVNATSAATMEYSIDNGGSWQASATFSGLTPGNYNIVVRLQASPSCFTSYSGNPVVINAVPVAPVVNAPTVTHPTCAVPSGTIVVNATGASTLEYSSNGGGSWQASATFSGLAPGNYNIAVRLQSSPTCVTNYAANPVVINAVPVAPVVNAPTVTQPTCAVPTGTIVINATGAGTLEYSSDGGGSWQLSNSFAGLAPGNYNIAARLQSSPTCVTNYAANPVVINAVPVAPVVNAPGVTHPTCAVPTGTIVVNATGAGTLEYSSDGGGSWQLSNSFAGLAPGNYNIAARLQSSTTCVTIYAANPVVINAVPVTPVVNAPTVTQPTCAVPTGTIVVNATGTGTLEYSSNGGGSWQASATFSGLAPGNYNIAVRLQSSPTCVTNYAANPVVINAVPIPPVVNAPTVTQPVCAVPTGTIVVNATGAGTLEYSIDGGGVWQTSNTFSGLATGNYNIAVRLQSSPTCVTNYAANPVVIDPSPLPTVTVPANQSVCNNAATTTITFTGSTVVGTVYNWTNNTTSIGLAANGTGNINSFVATNNTSTPVTATITITPVAFACVGNPQTFTITVNPTIAITTGPAATQMCSGGTASFNVVATGTPVITYQWQINPGTGFVDVTNVAPFSGATTATLSINGATAIYNGNTFRVVVNSGCGSNTSGNAVLTVNPLPTVTVTPNNQCGPVLLTAAGTANTYSWSPAAGLSATTGATVTANPTVNTVYTVTGTITATGCTNTATATVNATPAAPVTTPSAITICTGATTQLTAAGSGITWTPATGLFTNASATIAYVAGAVTNSVYAKPATTTTYQATASTPTCVSLPTSVVVTVAQVITITTQPATQTVCQGATVTFSVVTTGNLQTYQWQLNTGTGFNNIAGANASTLVLPSVATSLNNYQYRVLVTNGCTSLTSATAVLTVNASPVVTATPIVNRICNSDTLVALSATPGGGVWSGVGVSGNNFIPTATGVGTYTLTYSYAGTGGCVSTATVVAKVEDCPERQVLLRNNAVILFPNPNTGRFNIKINSTLYNYLGMSVYTSAGQLVRTQNFGGLVYGRVIPIDLTSLPGGVYTVHFYYNSGNRTSDKSFQMVIGR